jgi:hypothetical protein
MPKKTKTKVKQPKKPTNKNKNKNKNKNIQSVKVNVTSSGGGGGASIPQSQQPQQQQQQPQPQYIPQFIPRYINERVVPDREERIFKNIVQKDSEMQTQTPIPSPVPIKKSFTFGTQTEPTAIFWEDLPDVEEDYELYDPIQPPDIPILNPRKNNDNDTLLERLKNEPPILSEEGAGGGGGGPGPVSYSNIEIEPLKTETYIYKVGKKYVFKFRQANGEKYDTLAEAQEARDRFIKDNNIKFKEKK